MVKFGQLGKQARDNRIDKISASATAGRALERCALIASALRESSDALCDGNGVVYRRSIGVLARASGHALMAGVPVPTSDVLLGVYQLLFEHEPHVCFYRELGLRITGLNK